MGFQRNIKEQPAPAVAGDLASNNPMATAIPPNDGAFVVAAGQSVCVGYFAWGGVDGKVYSSAAGAGAGATIGFVARQPNIPASLITAFLGEATMLLQEGRECTLLTAGDFYIDLPAVDPGDAIFADNTTGAPSLVDDASTDPTGFTGKTQSKVNAVTAATTTIAVTTGIMTIATVSSGVVEAGQRVTGTGVPAETYIQYQISGTPGGAGTYQTNSRNRAAVAAFAATMVQGTKAIIGKATG